ncbi:GNAT family N-acetyltransferase [Roseibium denhamense]|nr:GNAT family N-acetyltransferase [Roseibium denhamense]
MQDAGAIKQCIEAAYAPVKQRISDLPDVSSGIKEDIARNTVLVACSGTSIQGCIICGLDGTAKGHIMNLAVDPVFAGRGIGKQLIKAAEARLTENGARSIDLATHVGMPENVDLYSRLGWTETSRQDNKVTMTKPVSASSLSKRD